MDAKFCTNCGHALDADYAYCPECGAAIVALPAQAEPEAPADERTHVLPKPEPGEPTSVMSPAQPTEVMGQGASANAQVPTQPLSGAAAPAIGAAYQAGQPQQQQPQQPQMGFQAPGGTTPMAPLEAQQQPSAQPVSYTQNNAVPQEKKRRTPLIVGVVVLVIAAIVLAALAISSVLANQNTEEPKDLPPVEQPKQDDAENNSSNKQETTPVPESSKQTTSPEDQRIYEQLMRYYDLLAEFDEDIADEAEDFNNNWSKSDYDKRTEEAMDVGEVITDIYQASDELYRLGVTAGSEYYTEYKAIQQLYEDCQNRISVISEAWTRSLEFSDPKAHQDYILAPISADNESGKNKYKKHFDANYKNARPHDPIKA